MTRRTAERHPRRIEVRFWRRGQPQPHSGFTIDLSRSGMFLGTAVPLAPGERVRLEVVDRVNGFVIEGEVARVHKVALALRHVEQPGVGVRFLPAHELVGGVIKREKPKTESVALNETGDNALAGGLAEPDRSSAPAPVPEPVSSPPIAPPSSAPASPESRRAASARAELDDLFDIEPAASPPGSSTGSVGAETPAETAPKREQKTVPVEFVDRASFLAVYQRDIAAGGLFVTTDDLPVLHSRVTIELRPPVSIPYPLRFEAKVVHRFEGGGGKSEMMGIGVQFFDPDRVRAALAPVLAELRR